MAIRTVSIIGLGAEGSVAYCAARKTLPFENVRIIAKGERAKRLKENGIIINGEHYKLNVKEPGEVGTPPDLLIVAVKIYSLDGAMCDILAEVGENTSVISMINGLSSENLIAKRLECGHVIYSMSKVNSKKSGNSVNFKPVGHIVIGEKDGSVNSRLMDIRNLFSHIVTSEISRDIHFEIWKKYMMNSACNTVEAIFRGQHSWFQKIPEARDAMRCIMTEIMLLANKLGVPIKSDDIEEIIGLFDSYAPDGMCSMVQDVLAKRPTEIEMFMGDALKMGKENGVELPVCRFVYDLIKSIDKANSGILETD